MSAPIREKDSVPSISSGSPLSAQQSAFENQARQASDIFQTKIALVPLEAQEPLHPRPKKEVQKGPIQESISREDLPLPQASLPVSGSVVSFVRNCATWAKKKVGSLLCKKGAPVYRSQSFVRAQTLASNPEENEALLGTLSKFRLTEKQEQSIIDLVVEKNPTAVYEHWKRVKEKVNESEQQRIQSRIPFFALAHRLEALEQNLHLSIEELEPILAEVHQLNKTVGIPMSLYAPSALYESYALDSLVKKIAERCQSGPELLHVVDVLSRNFFVGTNWLLAQVYPTAVEKFPELRTFVVLHEQSYGMTTPFLMPEGARWVVSSKLEQKERIRQVTTTEVFYWYHLEEKIRQFNDSEYQKATFLICHSDEDAKDDKDDVPEHYSPLYVEKEDGKLKVLSSDSIDPDAWHFTRKIVKQFLRVTDLPLELYIAASGRQSDGFSCVVFTIKDLIAASNAAEAGESIFTHLTSEAGSPLFDYDTISRRVQLPSQMMTLTQSLQKTASIAHQIVKTKKRELTLGEHLTGHVYVAPMIREVGFWSKKHTTVPQPRNLAAAEKAAHYFERMLRHVIANSST